MKPSQKELNEFVLDLVEFMGKHFSGYFDKTRVAGGNEGLSVRVRKAACGSELEITTDRLDPYFEFEGVRWHHRELSTSKELLFARILSDLIAVFSDRLLVISGSMGGMRIEGVMSLDVPETVAISRFRDLNPGCEKVVLKKWSAAEAVISPREI